MHFFHKRYFLLEKNYIDYIMEKINALDSKSTIWDIWPFLRSKCVEINRTQGHTHVLSINLVKHMHIHHFTNIKWQRKTNTTSFWNNTFFEIRHSILVFSTSFLFSSWILNHCTSDFPEFYGFSKIMARFSYLNSTSILKSVSEINFTWSVSIKKCWLVCIRNIGTYIDFLIIYLFIYLFIIYVFIYFLKWKNSGWTHLKTWCVLNAKSIRFIKILCV